MLGTKKRLNAMLTSFHLVPEHQIASQSADISHTSTPDQLHVVGKLLAVPAIRNINMDIDGQWEAVSLSFFASQLS